MTLTPGTRLGRYEVAAAIGAGGMGEIYRARDTTLGRDVAIKTLPAELARDPRWLARLESETRGGTPTRHRPSRSQAGQRDGDASTRKHCPSGETSYSMSAGTIA